MDQASPAGPEVVPRSEAGPTGRAPHGRRWLWVLLLAGLAACGWVIFAWLLHLPTYDEVHRRVVIYYAWGHLREWWMFISFAVAAVATALVGAIAVVVLGRMFRGALWGLIVAMSALLWCAGAAYLALCGIVLSFGAYDPMALSTPDGDRVILTDTMDDPTYHPIFMADRDHRFVDSRQEIKVIDPQASSCRLGRLGAAGNLRVTCGSSTTVIPAPER